MRVLVLITLLFATSAQAGAEREVINGDIIHTATAANTRDSVALFIAEQSAIKAISAECGFPHRDIKIFKRENFMDRKTGLFYAVVSAGIDYPSCDEAKAASNNPKRRTRLSNPSLVAEQKKYDHYIEEQLGVKDDPDLYKYLDKKFRQVGSKQDVANDRLSNLEGRLDDLSRLQPSRSERVVYVTTVKQNAPQVSAPNRMCDYLNSQATVASINEGSHGNMLNGGKAQDLYMQAQAMGCP